MNAKKVKILRRIADKEFKKKKLPIKMKKAYERYIRENYMKLSINERSV